MVFRGANKQKHVFKKNPKAPIWGKPPKVIGGKLLASGYWDAMAQEQQHGVGHRQPRSFDVDDLVNNVSQVAADNTEMKERISILEAEVSTLKQLLLHHLAPPPSSYLGGNPVSCVRTPFVGYGSPVVHSTGLDDRESMEQRGEVSHIQTHIQKRKLLGGSTGATIGNCDIHPNPVTDNPNSNLCTRVKTQPRKCVKGKCIQTPYTEVQKKKKTVR